MNFLKVLREKCVMYTIFFALRLFFIVQNSDKESRSILQGSFKCFRLFVKQIPSYKSIHFILHTGKQVLWQTLKPSGLAAFHQGQCCLLK